MARVKRNGYNAMENNSAMEIFTSLFIDLHSISLEATLKGKNLLPLRANSLLGEQTPVLNGFKY